MLRLFICADKIERQKIEKICISYMKCKKLQCEIISTDNCEEQLYGQPIDIFIIDKERIKENWTRVRDYFARNYSESDFIFLVKDYKNMMGTLGLRVLGFVNKENFIVEINDLLKIAVYKIGCLGCSIDGKYDSREIAYIKAEHVYSRIVTKQGESFLYRQSLSKLEEYLSDYDFIRTHRSFLVNVREIQGEIGKEVMVCRFKIPVSVRMKSEVEKVYEAFRQKNDFF